MTATEHAVTPLVSEIEALVEGIHGWSPVDELFTLSMLAHATAHLPGDIVEVGAWYGRSSIVLGAAARDTHGRVHSIDLFPERGDWRRNEDGTYSFAVTLGKRVYGGYQQQTVWAEPFESQVAPLYDDCPSVLGRFTENVRTHRLEHVVLPHRGTAATFAARTRPSFRCRLIFIDGDHGYDAVREDITRLTPFLVPGGWICFDDAFSSYEGVDRAITELVLADPSYDVKRQMTRKCFAARKTEVPVRS
jgi:predicted O-methyltransferase YrrM